MNFLLFHKKKTFYEIKKNMKESFYDVCVSLTKKIIFQIDMRRLFGTEA